MDTLMICKFNERFERMTDKVNRGHRNLDVKKQASSECRKDRISLAWLAKTTRQQHQLNPDRKQLHRVVENCTLFGRRARSGDVLQRTRRWSNKRVLLPSETAQICQTLALCQLVSRPGARIDPV